MYKTPFLAIIISILAVIGIYIFLDIKPNQKKTTAPTLTTSSEKIDYIVTYNNGLDESTQENINTWLSRAETLKDTLALDSLILFYENLQQYNFAAYYHTLRAEILDKKQEWELAGDRQFSVSKNNAYDSTFNALLLQKAISSYEKALSYDTNDLNVQVKIGEAYMGDPTQPMKGITQLLNVIKKDSMHIKANLSLGKFGLMSGQYDKALNRLEKVLSLQPENTEALLLAAEAETNLGNFAEAINKLEKCKSLVDNPELKKNIELFIQRLK